MSNATEVTDKKASQKNKSIVSCFVAKCTETVIAALLRSNYKDRYLQQFSDNDPVQRDAIKAFLHGETHYVLPAIKYKDRVNFVRLYAVLCSSILDKQSLLLEAITKMYPKLPADSKLLAKAQSEAALTLLSVGILTNQQYYIDIALGKNKNGRTEEEQEEYIGDFMAEKMLAWRENYAFGFTELNPYGCALLLYSSWSNNPETCLNALQICRMCSCISDVQDEVDLDKVSEIIENCSLSFSVSDYTKNIHYGMDLIKRIQAFFDAYNQVSTVMTDDIPSYSLSSINALWLADYLQPRSSIGLLFGKEVVTKEDRYLALRCAMFQYEKVVKDHEMMFVGYLEQYGDFTALSRMFQLDELEEALINGEDVLHDELSNSDAAFVMERLRCAANDSVGAKFEETYLLTLYKILIERIIIRQECEALESYFFDKNTESKDDGKVKSELAALYAKCSRLEEQINKLKETVSATQKKAEDVAQYKDKVERKNAIIGDLKRQIEALKKELAQRSGDAPESIPPASAYDAEEPIEPEDEQANLTDEEVHLALLELCERYTVILVDGHENFHRRLSEAQPNIRMLSGDDVQRKNNALTTADFVFCKSSAYGSHTAMEKAISATKGTSAHFILLSKITNIEQCEREIYSAIMNCISKEGKNSG